jgi:phage/plasmid-like protein (TIGR03299 family)
MGRTPMAETQIEGSVPVDATAQNRPDLFGTRGQIRPDGDGGMISMMMADKPEYATPADSKIDTGFYVGSRGLPWHVTLARALGEADRMVDSETLLTIHDALEKSGGNYTVAFRNLYVEGSTFVYPGKFATVREDSGAPLGIVGRQYKIMQNEDLAKFGDALVDSGEAKYETGGVMNGGATYFLSMELDHLEISVPRDPSALKMYLLLFTTHDGTRPVQFLLTRVRAVCKNTCDLARKGAVQSYRIKHTQSLDGRVAEARRALGIAFKATELDRQITEMLAGKHLAERQIREILEAAWPKVDENDEEETEKRAVGKAMDLYETSPNLEGIRGTAWGAYNAVTEFVDHEVTYRSRFGDATEHRAESLLFGDGHDVKERALRAAIAK